MAIEWETDGYLWRTGSWRLYPSIMRGWWVLFHGERYADACIHGLRAAKAEVRRRIDGTGREKE